MPIEYEGKKLYNATEAAKFIGSSREQFLKNLAGQLQTYRVGAGRRDLYLEDDLLPYKGVRPATESPEKK
jgi:hypothetical protein